MRPRILLVDDNPLDRELAAWVLRKLPEPPGPIALTSTGDWDEANQLLHGDAVDLLLLDVELSGRSGIDLLRSLGSQQPTVIMITGHDDEATSTAARDAGAWGVVRKDLDWGLALGRMVTSALDRITPAGH